MEERKAMKRYKKGLEYLLKDRRHNFSIFYRILEEQNEIEIIAFWDNRNDPEKLQF